MRELDYIFASDGTRFMTDNPSLYPLFAYDWRYSTETMLKRGTRCARFESYDAFLACIARWNASCSDRWYYWPASLCTVDQQFLESMVRVRRGRQVTG